MTTRLTLALLIASSFGSATTLYGTYQISVTHSCNDPSCTTSTDVLTGTGSNNLQGPSAITDKQIEYPSGDIVGQFTLTGDNSTIIGTWISGFDAMVASPLWRATGDVTFTGGTGPYADFSGSQSLLGTGLFTGQTSAVGTLTFAPEPQTWALLAIGCLLFAVSCGGAIRRGLTRSGDVACARDSLPSRATR